MDFVNGTNRPPIAFFTDDVVTITEDIECHDGDYLSGEAVADFVVEARLSGAVSWTNIETSTIDLSAYDGTIQTFEIRFTAGTITERDARLFTLTVGSS